jgi:tetratricopeptide (TPR) repeat protein
MLVSLPLFAGDVDELMRQGNSCYQKQQYSEAVSCYEKIITQGYTGSNLHYNLGNAYFKRGSLGLAILNYERALRLAPRDEDIKHNLRIANSRTADRISVMPKMFLLEWWDGLLGIFSVSGWTWFSYFLFILLLSFIALFVYIRNIRAKKIIFISSISVAAILIFSVIFLFINIRKETMFKPAIVTAPSATAKLAPDQQSADSFLIHEGTKINIEDKVDIWNKVKLSDGKTGWVRASEITKI